MWLILALLASVPHGATIDDRCDAILVEHVYASDGRKTFTQIIFIDYAYCEPQRRIVAWRLVKQHPPVTKLDNGEYEALWLDGDELRRVRARAYSEVWRHWDSELFNRHVWPKDQRRGLYKRRTTSTTRESDLWLP